MSKRLFYKCIRTTIIKRCFSLRPIMAVLKGWSNFLDCIKSPVLFNYSFPLSWKLRHFPFSIEIYVVSCPSLHPSPLPLPAYLFPPRIFLLLFHLSGSFHKRAAALASYFDALEFLHFLSILIQLCACIPPVVPLLLRTLNIFHCRSNVLWY